MLSISTLLDLLESIQPYQVLKYIGIFIPVYAVYKTLVYPFFLHPLRRLPGPSTNPFTFIGQVPAIIKEEATAPHYRWVNEHGKILKYHHFMNSIRLVVASPTGLKRVLNNAYIYPKPKQQAAALESFIGKGLLTAEGDVHKRQRALLNPVFRVKFLNSLVPLFAESATELKNQWIQTLDSSAASVSTTEGVPSTEKGEHIFNIYEEMSKATLDVIGRAGFGYDFNAISKGTSPLFSSYQILMSRMTFSIRTLVEVTFPFLRQIPTKRRAEMQQAQKVITDT
ncbi:hypothetical protein HDV05_008659, partial [Chytridiales sp. JEL 0842]